MLCVFPCEAIAAEPQADDTVVQLVIDLLGSADRDMRVLGLQQVREEVRGTEATKRFAAMLPKLPSEGQAALLDALGERRDAAARPAVLEMLRSDNDEVRAAALRAMGNLGTAADVPLLVPHAAAKSEALRRAAGQALVRLRGDDVNRAVIAALKQGPPQVQAALVEVLAARHANEAVPAVLQCAAHPDVAVRLAALGALRSLAEAEHTAALVKLVKAAHDQAERSAGEAALLAVCGRGRQGCAQDVAAGMSGADPASRAVLLHALARAGGPQALEATVARLKDDDQAVRDEAVRMLSNWSERDATPHLLKLAKSTERTLYRVLAIRGLVRLAAPQAGRPADLKTLGAALSLAPREEEKRLVLAALGETASEQALGLLVPLLADPSLADEAGLVAVNMAEKLKGGDRAKLRAVMEEVAKQAKSPVVRERVQALLKSL